ncbi:putative xanthine dehydrogenase [Arabidopsis thaliana]
MKIAGALVHVCTNGTVLVTHGGVEMGQGFAYKGCVIPLSQFLCQNQAHTRYI